MPVYNYWADKNDFLRAFMIYSYMYFHLKSDEIIEVAVTKLFGLKKFVDLLRLCKIKVQLPFDYEELVIKRTDTKVIRILLVILIFYLVYFFLNKN